MLKKFLTSALFALALAVGPVGAPAAAADDACLLHAGCYLYEGSVGLSRSSDLHGLPLATVNPVYEFVT